MHLWRVRFPPSPLYDDTRTIMSDQNTPDPVEIESHDMPDVVILTEKCDCTGVEDGDMDAPRVTEADAGIYMLLAKQNLMDKLPLYSYVRCGFCGDPKKSVLKLKDTE